MPLNVNQKPLWFVIFQGPSEINWQDDSHWEERGCAIGRALEITQRGDNALVLEGRLIADMRGINEYIEDETK